MARVKSPAQKSPGFIRGLFWAFSKKIWKSPLCRKNLRFLTWCEKILTKLCWFSSKIKHLFTQKFLIFLSNHNFFYDFSKSLQYRIFLMVLSFFSNFCSFIISCVTRCLLTTICVHNIFWHTSKSIQKNNRYWYFVIIQNSIMTL